ncbi:MAG: hypothetical protein AAF734_01125 [Bacteroidota bacterium]
MENTTRLTPLMLAAGKGEEEKVTARLVQGASPFILDGLTRTPAQEQGFKEMLTLLE